MEIGCMAGECPKKTRMESVMALLKYGAGIVLLTALAAAALQQYRWMRDQTAAQAARERLLARTIAGLPERFDPVQVETLPEPAQRFFRFAITPGARLCTVAQIRMGGTLSLGTRDAPKYQPMQAQQVLAAPHGLLWEVWAGQGAMRFAGSDGMADGKSWTRFWLWRLIPVARQGGDADHLRSSFGRAVAEAAFWTPAVLLPRDGIAWTAVDADTAQVTVQHQGLVQSMEIRVAPSGQPLWVLIPRWSQANADRIYREQPFGGTLADFREVNGFRLPFRVEGGNFFGTDEYFPFYRAEVQEISLR